jgi:very-short-patch-repair endonuclease
MGTEKLHNRHSRKSFRQQLRSYGTSAEAVLWTRLKKSQLGAKFRRQHGVGPFVLDFYCAEVRLAVELEGQVHRDEFRSDRDARRHRYLVEHGIEILYFENKSVWECWEVVEARIKEAIGRRRGGGG